MIEVNSLSVGKVIYSILSSNENVTKLVNKKIYPLVVDADTKFPYIVYRRSSVEVTSSKDRLINKEEAMVELVVASDKYEQSIDIASVVREALDNVKGSFGGLKVKGIYFISADEDYIEDTFIQRLNYKIEIK